MTSTQQERVDQFNDLMVHMSQTKEQLDQELQDEQDDPSNARDRLLNDAIEFAIEQGRGWGPGEKEAYLQKISDDDFLPPLFANTVQDVENSGLQDAFTSLIYENETPTTLMLQFKDKGQEAFVNGKRNQANNLQYYRDAINHYYESLAWANKIQPLHAGDLAQADTDEPTYTPTELEELKSNLCSNVALMHLQLRNWGLARDEARKALEYSNRNVKAWYRLAKSYQMLQQWEPAGEAVESGLAIEPNNKDLLKLQHALDVKVRQARTIRQQREKAKAQRASQVKQVWMHCKKQSIQLGRVSLVNRVNEDDDHTDNRDEESKWHQHLPHSGRLPVPISASGDSNGKQDWSWPVLFVYPSHHQSDFIERFPENDMLAVQMAELFPELDDDDNIQTGGAETAIVWDTNNEFRCSQLAVYFEVHGVDEKEMNGQVVHPESVERLRDLATCMKYYEATRALKGDEGQDVADVVRAIERKRLAQQQAAWKKKHGSLWAKPDPCPVVRVHPAMTLRDVLTDSRMIVPNFLVTFILFPENHPAHEAFLKEHKCLGILQPK